MQTMNHTVRWEEWKYEPNLCQTWHYAEFVGRLPRWSQGHAYTRLSHDSWTANGKGERQRPKLMHLDKLGMSNNGNE